MEKSYETNQPSKLKKIYEVGETCKLSELKVGQAGKLISFSNDNKALRRRLLDMGLTKNVTIDIQQISPLGDPISVELRGYQLCMRKEDMENILVTVTKRYISPEEIKEEKKKAKLQKKEEKKKGGNNRG
ncbi:MAG: ferrous iron transport protein A [Anaeroplasmataceae bacterium]|nr:ferrous iron transport protein A [Anaeroplasmataceae bacterium]